MAFKCISFWKFANEKIKPQRLQQIREEIVQKCQVKDPSIKGRVYLASEGINGQMMTPSHLVGELHSILNQIPEFEKIKMNKEDRDYFINTLGEEDQKSEKFQESKNGKTKDKNGVYLKTNPFESLTILIRNSIISAEGTTSHTYNEDELNLLENLGEKLSAEEWHKEMLKSKENLLEETKNISDKELVILDCRNNYEYDVGRFIGSIPLGTSRYSESFEILDQMKEDLEKKRVLLYCTGGIRCVKIAAYLNQKLNIKNTGMLDGGIIAYSNYISSLNGIGKEEAKEFYNENASIKIETIDENESLYKGMNFVFDERIVSEVTSDKLANCVRCSAPTNRRINCSNTCCSLLVDFCDNCFQQYQGNCRSECEQYFTFSDEEKKWIRKETGRILRYFIETDKSTNHYRNPKVHFYSLALQNFFHYYKDNANNNNNNNNNNSVKSKNSTQKGESQAQVYSHSMDVLDKRKELEIYANSHSLPLDKYLDTVAEKTQQLYPKNSHQLCGSTVAQYLQFLIKLTKAKKILEIGTFTGYSAIAMASSLPNDGHLVTCETSSSVAEVAKSFIDEFYTIAPHKRNIISLRVQKGMDYLKSYLDQRNDENDGFDFIFIDADKKSYFDYYQFILNNNLLTKNGCLVFDNVLWKSLVLNEANEDPQNHFIKVAVKMREFNDFIVADERVEHYYYQ